MIYSKILWVKQEAQRGSDWPSLIILFFYIYFFAMQLLVISHVQHFDPNGMTENETLKCHSDVTLDYRTDFSHNKENNYRNGQRAQIWMGLKWLQMHWAPSCLYAFFFFLSSWPANHERNLLMAPNNAATLCVALYDNLFYGAFIQFVSVLVSHNAFFLAWCSLLTLPEEDSNKPSSSFR